MTLRIGRRLWLAGMLGLLLPAPLAARAAAAPKPLIVLIVSDPWLMVIGSDSPAFALYDDGTVIYATEQGYKSVKLDASERKALTDSLDTGALAAAAGQYDGAPGVSDQPFDTVLLFGEGKPAMVRVYGRLDQPEVRAHVPAKVALAYDRLRGFTHPRARDWLPEKIEVMVWPYEHAVDPSIVWPGSWPGLTSPGTVKRGDSYSIFLPSSEQPALVRFLKTEKPRGAVEIAGRKWSVATRYPFPGEPLWLHSSKE